MFGVNPEYASMAFLDGFKPKEIGDTGDSKKKLITADVTLRLDAEKAMFKIADLTA